MKRAYYDNCEINYDTFNYVSVGVGALYVRRRPRVRVETQMSGGGQERGVRSGTLPAPLIVGFGEACAIACCEREFDYEHVSRLAKRLIEGINSQLKNVVHNGDDEMWYPGKDRFFTEREVKLSKKFFEN